MLALRPPEQSNSSRGERRRGLRARRHNPAQIFGEFLTLLEGSRRSNEEAMEVVYRQDADERVYIQRNLHVIGMMIIADRSLALVDLALRRRFAFIHLAPQLNGLSVLGCRFAETRMEPVSRGVALAYSS
ncbi:hypothetical protein GOC73_27840 [Sinorhizobium medicae]|nr:hypothetical protein [Sinorhizobium medicae]MDX0691725.1 hypothetical protein [Sinorhizobium medicae]